MKRCYNEFNRGYHSLTDELRKDRPKLVVGLENINAVQKLIMRLMQPLDNLTKAQKDAGVDWCTRMF